MGNIETRTLEEILAQIESGELSTESELGIANTGAYSSSKTKSLRKIKPEKGPILVVVPLRIKLEFDPTLGKMTDKYNETMNFFYPVNPEEAMILLKYHCQKSPATARFVQSKVSEKIPKWDYSDITTLTTDDKIVFNNLADPYIFGKKTTIISKKVLGGEYDTTVDLTVNSKTRDLLEECVQMMTSVIISHKMNLKEAVKTKTISTYVGPDLTPDRYDILKIDWDNIQDDTRQICMKAINALYPSSGAGHTPLLYALKIEAFDGTLDIWNHSTKTFSDSLFEDMTEEQFLAAEGYLKYNKSMKELLEDFRKTYIEDQHIFGTMQFTMKPPANFKEMKDPMEIGKETVWSLASKTTFSSELVSSGMSGYRFPTAEEFELKIAKHIQQREGLEALFQSILSRICKAPTETMLKTLSAYIRSNFKLDYIYFTDEIMKYNLDAFTNIYGEKFIELAESRGILEQELEDDEIKLLEEGKKKALEEFKEEDDDDEDLDFNVEEGIAEKPSSTSKVPVGIREAKI